MVPNDRMIMNDELERIGKKMLMVHTHLSGGTEQKSQDSQSMD
jgi:hypothetical protein